MSMTRPGCHICADERGPLVNAYLQAGRTAAWIERDLRARGFPTKQRTVRNHLIGCLNGDPANAAILQHAIKGDGSPGPDFSPNADFAQAIRAEANKALAEGRLTITAQHGLAAQQLIDRRAEKAADRRLMVQLAGLLSGSLSLEDGPPADLIEAEWHEVEGESVALAPLALVAGAESD